ncbi:E3 ubiquitin-protein ligase TRIM21-like [Solea solea]|uniref:E3 ubiquitin-protein ligase TRIM21-like n=1 Tax=Solea solea TaxID=90069 RepID=UPI002729513C|nr:E3 ubiquitin-protein ligase TRIM21-like [Solea solea]
MASAPASPSESSSLENHLKCSICMDTFTDPVTTACGHSFCKMCLEFHVKYNDRVCPLCNTPITSTLDVKIVLREIVQNCPIDERMNNLEAKDDEVVCDICTSPKLKAVKSCLVCLASYCLNHLKNHSSTERLKGHKLVAPVEDLDKRACLKHGRPLELYSREQQRCICVGCLEEDPLEVVSTEDEWEKKKIKLQSVKNELETQINRREKNLHKLNQALQDCKNQMDNESRDIDNVFNTVIAIVEEAQDIALQPLRDRRQVMEKEVDDLKQKLKAEIRRFQKNITDLDGIATLEDHIHFLQEWPCLEDLVDTNDFVEVEFDTSLCFETIRKTTTIMTERVQQELDKLTSIELNRAPKFTVDVKLDPTTAHQRLVVSDDGKEVKDGGKDQEVDDSPKRFDTFGSILGVNSLSSGRSYWEVETNKKTGWDLGVARVDANRKGKLSLNPDNGYWVIVHYEDEKFAALTAPPHVLSLQEKPQRVGVFVDYEEGLVSFYNLTTQSHIYSFTKCSFTGELLPYFSPHQKQDDKNSNPLIISPVKQCEWDMDANYVGISLELASWGKGQ